MLKNRLANTDIFVSAAGLGTTKFGRNQKVHYPHAFTLPSEKEMIGLLDLAQELGINLLDTAPAYGESEARLGKCLVGKRDQWVISTKAGEEFINGESHYDFSAPFIRQSIDSSLERLKTDYLDIVLIHSNGDDEKIIEHYDVFATLGVLKQEGKIRAYGMSTKTVEGGLQALQASDLAMVTYNPQHTLEQPVIAHAHQHQKGIFIKKALASGHLAVSGENEDPVMTAMRFICKQPGITSIILGTINPEHLKHNVNCIQEAQSA